MTSFEIHWQDKSYLKVKNHTIISEITCNWENDYPNLLLTVLEYNITGINKNGQHNNKLCVSAVEFPNCVLPEHSNLRVWCQCSIVKKLLPLGTYLQNVLHKGAVYYQGEHQQLPSVRWSNKLSELVLLVQRCFIDHKNFCLTRCGFTKWNHDDKGCAVTTFILSIWPMNMVSSA